ncbi:uncharacterized protein PHALS_02123 [Plasmopara halstedii]|uniref:Uncharacterized protein n=1 Tax=Plasmopara halstedii TaxID=4781 RepID=A0A0P1AUL1_PLAHL|nr:uncharacterized protein PHALS_02123 [Plasmopara halstedii]CEG45850.1 hypothetical protein PHALS_02123 [Plasmopara halstedii]|eukprot:XP_024582219.1 hypothetical protein PHALS_02123 [Plasmopara halstedii]
MIIIFPQFLATSILSTPEFGVERLVSWRLTQTSARILVLFLPEYHIDNQIMKKRTDLQVSNIVTIVFISMDTYTGKLDGGGCVLLFAPNLPEYILVHNNANDYWAVQHIANVAVTPYFASNIYILIFDLVLAHPNRSYSQHDAKFTLQLSPSEQLLAKLGSGPNENEPNTRLSRARKRIKLSRRADSKFPCVKQFLDKSLNDHSLQQMKTMQKAEKPPPFVHNEPSLLASAAGDIVVWSTAFPITMVK